MSPRLTSRYWVGVLHSHPSAPPSSQRTLHSNSASNPHSPRSAVATIPSSTTILNVVSRNIPRALPAGHPRVARSLASKAAVLNVKSTTRALSTTPVVHDSSQGPFSFLPANKPEKKVGRGERSKGLTEIRGSYYNPVTYTYLNDLLSDWGVRRRLFLVDAGRPS